MLTRPYFLPKMLSAVVDTATGTVIAFAFASVIVAVHAPVSAPVVIVNVTAAPAEAGVAVAGLIVATNALLAGGVTTAGFGVQLIAALNAAVSPASITVKVAVGVLPGTGLAGSSASEFGAAASVDCGAADGAAVAGDAVEPAPDGGAVNSPPLHAASAAAAMKNSAIPAERLREEYI
jgi:hypothetical protein